MTRTETINKLIKEKGYESYLEIGTNDASNFDSVNIKNKKLVQDPDKFFQSNEDKFDLILIDGDHEAEQVEKDIVNAYKALNKGGVILLHDCNPPTKESQEVPRKQDQYCGTVWRAVVGFRQEYDDKIDTGYFSDPYGLFAIFKTGRFQVKEGFVNDEMTYEEFSDRRKELLGT